MNKPIRFHSLILIPYMAQTPSFSSPISYLLPLLSSLKLIAAAVVFEVVVAALCNCYCRREWDENKGLQEQLRDTTYEHKRLLVNYFSDSKKLRKMLLLQRFYIQQVRGEHAGCAEKLINAERERDELRAVNADQVSQIK
ncbi:hypothetical protein Tco_0516398, partial [Tanacetum coccineum]